MNDEQEYVDVKEACRILGVSRSTLDLYVRNNRLTRYEQGAPKRTMYKRAAVEALKRVKPKN